jgi:hypothetical protein
MGKGCKSASNEKQAEWHSVQLRPDFGDYPDLTDLHHLPNRNPFS